MKIFKLSKEFEVAADWNKTRYGFRHTATLFRDGVEIGFGKCCYYNRTWESYEYQSVLYEVVRKTKSLTDTERETLNHIIKEYNSGEVEQMMKTVSTIAKLGEIFCESQKDKNDWKKRMLKAGISGLDVPDVWHTLSEDEKERRLNKVIEFCESKRGANK